MKLWMMLSPQRRWARMLLAGAIIAPALGTAHALPVSAHVQCNPPVPCVDNTVTYQGNQDEFMIFGGVGVATAANAQDGATGLLRTVTDLVPAVSPDDASTGDGCQVYQCGSNTSSIWCKCDGTWKGNMGTGSWTGAWLQPNIWPNDGNSYGETGLFASVASANHDYGICGVSVGAHVTADSGTVQAENYQPYTTTTNASGSSTSFGWNANVSFDGGGYGVSGTEVVADAHDTEGAYDANKQTYYVNDWETNGSCPDYSVGVLGAAPWVVRNSGNGYIHWTMDWTYTYRD